MRLYMSKITTKEDVRNPRTAHSIVSACCRREDGRTLFRVEDDKGDPCLLLSTQAIPAAIATAKLITKTLDFSLVAGQRLRFKLRANPARRIGGGKREGIHGIDNQKAWIHTQGERHGFRVVSLNMRPEGTVKFGKISILSVVYDGILEVTCPEALENALVHGIGPAKAFGFGMLTIRAM